MIKRIGMLTSGGDCQALNATMRGVVKGLTNNVDELEVYGFDDGYKGLIYGKYRMLTAKDFSGILTQGGTILGTSRQPFKLMRVPDENGLDKVEAMKQTYYKLCLDCLVILGGNGTQKTANLLREEGLNIIHLPKTIDNDIYGTDMTFGFQSAVNVATNAIDCIHTTASSHGRVFIVEIMGHKVGSLTLHAGVAGGADIILIPEIPYDIKKVTEAIQKRAKAGKRFTILAVAEGAISKEDALLPKKKYKEKLETRAKKYPSVSYEIADQIFQEIRCSVSLPMLRKDFTIEEYQLYQAKAIGADGVLLICALLDTRTIARYLERCGMLGLTALVEAHNAEEVGSAVSAGAEIIGVNNRNLKNFTVDVKNSVRLRALIPPEVLYVSESGIRGAEDVAVLYKNGTDAVLIGETLMRSSDKAAMLQELKRDCHE
mgnify:CR=1 FL=1